MKTLFLLAFFVPAVILDAQVVVGAGTTATVQPISPPVSSGTSPTMTTNSVTFAGGSSVSDDGTGALLAAPKSGNTFTVNGSGSAFGTAPTNWGGTEYPIDIGANAYGALFVDTSANYGVARNARYTSSWLYKNSSPAQLLSISSAGDFDFYTAPSGTAGAAISWTKQFSVSNGGNATVTGNFVANGTGTHSFAGRLNVTGGPLVVSGGVSAIPAASTVLDFPGSVGRLLVFNTVPGVAATFQLFLGSSDNSVNATPLSITPTTTAVNNDLSLATAGKTISVKSGANAASGTVTLVAGTATITSTAIDVNTVIIFSEKTSGGTPGVYQPLAAVSAGSAVVTSAATDTSTYNWVALKVN